MVQKKILIVAKQNKVGLKMCKRLEYLIKDRADVSIDMSTALKLKRKGVKISRFSGDFVITLGGDGTFLRASHQTDLPILPVKLEGHGFLCNCTFEEMEKNLANLLKGNFAIEQKMRLKCTQIEPRRLEKIIRRILHKSYPPSLNEITFARKRPSKTLRVVLRIDNTEFNFIGDGLIISTPTGSTAYNASAGGSLIDPRLDVISLIPVCTFYSKIKPMIVPADKRIEVSVKGDCALIIDGQGGDYYKPEADFVIEKGTPIKIIKLVEENFYEKFKKEFL